MDFSDSGQRAAGEYKGVVFVLFHNPTKLLLKLLAHSFNRNAGKVKKPPFLIKFEGILSDLGVYLNLRFFAKKETLVGPYKEVSGIKRCVISMWLSHTI